MTADIRPQKALTGCNVNLVFFSIFRFGVLSPRNSYSSSLPGRDVYEARNGNEKKIPSVTVQQRKWVKIDRFRPPYQSTSEGSNKEKKTSDSGRTSEELKGFRDRRVKQL